MNAGRDDAEERGGDELLAAEYVLGAQPAEERAMAARRVESDRAFAALVERWEEHLSPMAAAYAETQAPEGVKAALDRRLFASTSMEPEGRARGGGLWASLAFWRGLSAAALAALTAYAAVPFLAPRPASLPPGRMVASLEAADSDVHFVALLDKGREEVALSRLSGDLQAGRNFELWMIEEGRVPVSMGVLPSGPSIRIELSPEVRAKIAAGAVLAISVEPEGGSPTGQPTGPVVAAGDMRDI